MKTYFSFFLMMIVTCQVLAGGDDYPALPTSVAMIRQHHRVHMDEDTFRHKAIFKGRRYCGILEQGFTDVLPHSSSGNSPAFNFDLMMGGHVTPWYSMGLSLGATVYGKSAFDLELMGDFRFYFGKRKRLMPYLSSPGGYIAKFRYDYYHDGTIPYRVARRDDGFIVNPTVGVRYAINHGFAVSMGVGYRMTGVFVSDDYSYHLVFDNGLTIKAGINF